MKAVPFIEAYKSPVNTISNIHRYHELVSQKFNPDLIVELFEGWEKGYWAGGGEFYEKKRVYRTYEDKRKNFHSAFRFEIMNEKNTLWMPTVASIPHCSLDDFINECKKRGIELIWKQEVVNNFIISPLERNLRSYYDNAFDLNHVM